MRHRLHTGNSVIMMDRKLESYAIIPSTTEPEKMARKSMDD
jgi:hypothetical protein